MLSNAFAAGSNGPGTTTNTHARCQEGALRRGHATDSGRHHVIASSPRRTSEDRRHARQRRAAAEAPQRAGATGLPTPRHRIRQPRAAIARKIRDRPDAPCQITCRSNVSSTPRLARVASAAVCDCTSSARWSRKPWNASRDAGRSSSTSAKNSPAGIARRSPRRRRPRAGPSLLAMVLVNKFLLHEPLNRQSKTYAREGIDRCLDACESGRRLRGAA
jgi:hypothetical protein